MKLDWTELAPLPDKFGYAGAFAGVSNGALIVAGGANFPDGGAPWTGSKKVWSDKIFALDKPDGKWKLAGNLPDQLGYGISVTWKNSLICIGGSNEKGHVASVFAMHYQDSGLTFEKLPDLPYALANSCGAVLGDIIYVAGGLRDPSSASTEPVFWALDLSQQPASRAWKELPSWPGAPRMLSVAGVMDGSFYLFSGADLAATNDGQIERKYLTDAYSYNPEKGWKKLADLPHAVVAAPGPVYHAGASNLLIFGGDDGILAAEASSLKEQHPGFSDVILSYDGTSNQWSPVGRMRTFKKEDAALNPNGSLWAPVTTSLVVWGKDLVFPSGEIRPAIRTPRVLIAHPAMINHR